MEGNDSSQDLLEEKKSKMYKIKGQLIEYADGTTEKTKMFEILDIPLDDYSDLEFNESEVRRIRMHVMKMKTGIQAMAPILCSGPVKCPFRYRCPIVDRSITTPDGQDIDFRKQDIKKFPLLRMCIFESEFLDFKRKQYIDEYGVDVGSPTELGMVNKLAELDLYEYRATLVLAHGDDKGEGMDLLKHQVTGSTMTGDVITRMELHPAFELKEKIHKMREDILKSMVGTRREQYKQAVALKKSITTDASSHLADLRERILSIEKESGTVVDAEYTEETIDD